MLRRRTARYLERIRVELRRAFAEAHTPREIAASFAIGTFITMLPTLGTGLLLFVVIAFLFSRINRIALFASVLVFNPMVKWGVYAASFTLGVFLLGPVPGISMADVSLTAGPDIVIRLVVGNLILAVVATVPSYFIVLRLATRYQSSQVGEVVENAVDELTAEPIAEPED